MLRNLPFFSQSGDPNSGDYAGFFGSWEKLAGQKLSQYSRIVDIENNSLLIEVDHPAIIQLLQMKYSEILGKVRRNYPQLQIGDMRMFVKNPEYVKQREDRKNISFPGDEKAIRESAEKKQDVIESIDNENFRDLLRDMKKRSQL
nr:DUF721 domain-containing protein [Spirochaeta isovalerica]